MDLLFTEIIFNVLVCAAILTAFVALRFLDGAWLREWAAGRGFNILESRRLILGQWGWRLKVSFANWPIQVASALYRVAVLDRRGERRVGYVMLVRGMFCFRDHVETRWDGEGVADRASEAIRHYREMQAREQDGR